MDENDIALTVSHQIPDQHLIDVCKYRQGSGCCRYIYYPREKRDFYCVKTILEMKKKMDDAVSSMTAKGDNCQGLPNEKSERD